MFTPSRSGDSSPIDLDPVEEEDQIVSGKDREKLIQLITFARGVDWSTVKGLRKEYLRSPAVQLGFSGTGLYVKYRSIVQRNCPSLSRRNRKRKEGADSIQSTSARKRPAPASGVTAARSGGATVTHRWWSTAGPSSNAGRSSLGGTSSLASLPLPPGVGPSSKIVVKQQPPSSLSSSTSRSVSPLISSRASIPSRYTYSDKGKKRVTLVSPSPSPNRYSSDDDDDAGPSHLPAPRRALPAKEISSAARPGPSHMTFRLDHNERDVLIKTIKQNVTLLESTCQSLVTQQDDLRREIEQAEACVAQHSANIKNIQKNLSEAQEKHAQSVSALGDLRTKLEVAKQKSQQLKSDMAANEKTLAIITKK